MLIQYKDRNQHQKPLHQEMWLSMQASYFEINKIKIK